MQPSEFLCNRDFLCKADLVLYHAWGSNGTMSYAMRDLAPLTIAGLCFTLGVLFGGLAVHFWLSLPAKKPSQGG